MTTINFHAVSRAMKHWANNRNEKWSMEAYQKYLLEEYGIYDSIAGSKIVDEKKYILLLLRWA